jgi:hypothetical protein
MSVEFQWTAWHYIPEERTVDNLWCENLKSYIMYLPFTDCKWTPSQLHKRLYLHMEKHLIFKYLKNLQISISMQSSKA